MELVDFGPAPRPNIGLCPWCDTEKDAHWFRDVKNNAWYKGVFCGCGYEHEMEVYPHDKDGKPMEGGKWIAYPRP